MAGIASAAVIQAFHILPSSSSVRPSFSLNTSNIGNPLSAICNTSSVDSFPFACICHKANITPSSVSSVPPTAATAFPTHSNVGITLLAAKPNQSNCFVVSIIFNLLNGVFAAN